MISVKNVSKTFLHCRALNGVSFEIAKGEIVGFLGQNGAGKTTLMRVLTTFLIPDSGSAVIGGADVLRNSFAVRRKIGYLPETPPLYDNMTVEAYLRFAARLKEVAPRHEKYETDRVICACDLGSVRGRAIAALSKGFRQRVGIAQAIIHNPEVIILDEPTNGLDPLQIQHVRKLIQGLRENHTVIVSTHILPEIEKLTQRVLILKEGSLVRDGQISGLCGNGARTLEQTFLDIIQEPAP